MIRDALASGVDVTPALVSLVFFVTFFLSVVVWTYRRGAGRTYQQIGRLPFEDGERAAREVSHGSR